MSVEIVGPFDDNRLVVDGWQVPFVQAVEVDGGRVHFTVDHRLGYDVSAADFEQVAQLVATSIAVALGMPCFPNGETTMEQRQQMMSHLHIALRPVRLIGIASVETEEIELTESDDPRGPA